MHTQGETLFFLFVFFLLFFSFLNHFFLHGKKLPLFLVSKGDDECAFLFRAGTHLLYEDSAVAPMFSVMSYSHII